MKVSVVVPSAVTIAPEMQVDFGAIPPALVPIGGKVAVERIVEKFADHQATFYLAIHEHADLIEKHFRFCPDDRVVLVRVGPTRSLGETLTAVFEQHPEALDSPVVLNFADTIVEDLPSEVVGKDFISYAKTLESQRWTLFLDEGGRISKISDKEFLLDPSDWKTFLGAWGFADGTRFYELLRAQDPKSNKMAFYDAVIAYFNGTALPAELVASESYIDCGHADNYYAARRKLISARFFNVLEVNASAGTVRKRSENREKLIDEITWLQSLPKELRYYTPTIFDYSKNPLDPFLELEFYSYPSLDEAFVTARLDFDAWEKACSRIFEVITTAAKYTVKDENLGSDLREMYLDKTLARLKAVENDPALTSLWSGDLCINGVKTPSVAQVCAGLEETLEKHGALETDSFQIIHGDMCLGNLLYDPKHGLLKMIDARGRFGRFGIYGDVHYDLAKLSHSMLGLYDFIMADRYRARTTEDGGYTLEFRASEYHETVGQIFRKYVAQLGADLNRVRLLESLLFLSMVPLHKDSPDRQLAMLLRGLQIYRIATQESA